MSLIFLSLGSNLGDRNRHLIDAILLLAERVGEVRRVSTFHTTKSWGYTSSNDYLNAVVLLQTKLTPMELLAETQQIEISMGRKTKTVINYSDRIIDIDVLLYNNEIIDLPVLKIPHPLMLERDFVLKPLIEIAPDLIHPVTLKQFSEYIK
jgi:2-amino-4-hydroxy-6-hydroxymethyldihydropteridine diphosphokinase